MELGKVSKEQIKDKKPENRPDIRKSEDIDDLIFEEEGHKCSEK